MKTSRRIFPMLFHLLRAIATICLGASVLLTGPVAMAQTAQQDFQAGVAALQKDDLKTAREAFTNSLKLNSDQADTYYNLGLAEFKDKNTGLAIGLWRKALALAPDHTPAAGALAFALKKLEHPQIAHETELYETFRSRVLRDVPLSRYIVLANILLLLAGWLLLRYFGARRRALLDESPAPPLPTVAAVFVAGFIVATFLAGAKFLDLQSDRGTVIPAKLEARTTPDPNSTVLFELFEGLEVIVRQSNSDWLQVTYPGGMTGWVPRASIFISTGHTT